jgi:hypothetical protein
MAIDASRFAEITTQMHILWSGMCRLYRFLKYNKDYFSGPLQLIIALVLLYQQMQLAIVPGVALLLIMIPINAQLQRIQKNLTVCIARISPVHLYIDIGQTNDSHRSTNKIDE